MDRRLRVVQVFYTYDIEIGGGGLSRFAIELGKNLDPQRFEVSFCSLGRYDTPFEQKRIAELQSQGYQAYTAAKWTINKPYQSFVQAQKTLQAEFARQPVDILHSHSEFSDIGALLLKLQSKVPYILRTVHYGHNLEWHRRPWRRVIFTNFLYPLVFDAEAGINQVRTERLNRRWLARLRQRRAVCIYNAIDLERFREIHIDRQQKKRSLGIPPDAPVIGSVGRLAEQKGYSHLLDAASLILKTLPQAFFLIIGDGPLAKELQAQAERLEIAHHIIFTGSRTDVEELLVCMDVFASSSLWEGLPTVLLESMACGVPIVATDIPGTRELIHHNINGWLVAPRDAYTLSAGVLKVLHTPALQEELSRHALQTVENFTIVSVARQYEALYEALQTIPNPR